MNFTTPWGAMPGTGGAPDQSNWGSGAPSSLMQYNMQQGGGGFGTGATVPPQMPGGNANASNFDWMQFLKMLGYGGQMGAGSGQPQNPTGGLAMWNMMNGGGYGQPMSNLSAYRPPGGAGYVPSQGWS